MERCNVCGKFITENQGHRCLFPANIWSKSGELLATANGRTVCSSIIKAAKLAGLLRQKTNRPAVVNIIMSK
ncbi:MAG TPA: hypothetical protein VMQ58_02455 [Candidatus Saccharimonadales bacterium]|nr:hypothetical protein [Candidatus Saccharimonadales bacterium]